MSTQNALLTILSEKIANDTLVLPTLPAIAIKVRQSADNPDVNLHTMSEVVGQDPSLSARMIKISNSAYLGREVKVTSTAQAVTRIGLHQVKNIATALAMEQLFVSKNATVKQYMDKLWQDTIAIVGNSLALLALYHKRVAKKTFSADTMTLCALVANIGALPVLTEAERHNSVFANPEFLDNAIDQISNRIGGSILREWKFNEVFVDCAEHWRNLDYQHQDLHYIDFIRLAAALSGLTRKPIAHFEQAKMKGIFVDETELSSDEFEQLRDEAKAAFD